MSNEHASFEGVEKRLQVSFEAVSTSSASLRTISRADWDLILSLAGCQIVKMFKLPLFDSVILSESSLFIFDHLVILKTCGTTNPILAYDALVNAAFSIGLKPLDVVFSHNNFQFPERQSEPLQSLAAESAYLCHSKLSISGGELQVLQNPHQPDYWLVYSRAFSDTSPPECSTVDFLMFDLPDDVRTRFFRDKNVSAEDDERRMLQQIIGIVPEFDAGAAGLCFEPCGFSCNSHSGSRYLTAHVTPESAFSFASLEISCEPDTDIEAIAAKIRERFKPGRLIINILGKEKMHIPGSVRIGRRYAASTNVAK